MACSLKLSLRAILNSLLVHSKHDGKCPPRKKENRKKKWCEALQKRKRKKDSTGMQVVVRCTYADEERKREKKKIIVCIFSTNRQYWEKNCEGNERKSMTQQVKC